MSTVSLTGGAGKLDVAVVEDLVEDGYGLVRTAESPALVVAVLHDGTRRGLALAHGTAAVLAVAPAMRRLLDKALNIFREQFEEDTPVSGADLVDWFAGWRRKAGALLTQPAPPPETGTRP